MPPFNIQPFLALSDKLDVAYFSKQHKVYKIHNLTDEEATLLEPAACALHGLDKLSPPVGVEVLVLGAGPTGLILAQLLKLNGAARVTIAANAGPKMNLAKELDCGDVYVELARGDDKAQAVQWADLKKANPYGFDIVVEATGVERLAQESLNWVRRGGTLMIYGVYSDEARVSWPPSKIFGDEIRVGWIDTFLDVMLYADCSFADHWLVLAGVLLPARRAVPGQREGAREGHGDGRVQSRRLSESAGQNEQQGSGEDCCEAVKEEQVSKGMGVYNSMDGAFFSFPSQ